MDGRSKLQLPKLKLNLGHEHEQKTQQEEEQQHQQHDEEPSEPASANPSEAEAERQRSLEKKRSALSMLLESIKVGEKGQSAGEGGDSGNGGGGGGGAGAPLSGVDEDEDDDEEEFNGTDSLKRSQGSFAWGAENALMQQSRLGVVTYVCAHPSGAGPADMRHTAAILDDGMGVRDAASGAHFETVIQWMDSKEDKPDAEEVNYSSMAMNLNDWGDSSSSDSSSDDDDEDVHSSSSDDELGIIGGDGGTTHAVSVTTIYSATGEELATVTGNNVVRLTAASTWTDFKEKLKTLAHNVLRARVDRVTVFRAAPEGAIGADAVGTEIMRLEHLQETDTVYIAVPKPGDSDDMSYSPDEESSSNSSSGSGSGSGSEDEEQYASSFNAEDFAKGDSAGGFSGFSEFSLDAAAAEAKKAPPDDDLLTNEDEWATAALGGDAASGSDSEESSDNNDDQALPRTASDMDTLAMLAAEVETNKSPRRRKNRTGGGKLFSEFGAALEADVTLSPSGASGGRSRSRSRSGSHSHNSSMDFDALGIGNIDFSELGMQESEEGISMHANAAGESGESGPDDAAAAPPTPAAIAVGAGEHEDRPEADDNDLLGSGSSASSASSDMDEEDTSWVNFEV